MARVSKQVAVEALRAHGWRVHLAARELGCGSGEVRRWVDRSPELQELVADADGLIVDTAKVRLMEAVEKGEARAVEFAIKALPNEPAKPRGDEAAETERLVELGGELDERVASLQRALERR
jgi:hypothetical protein